MKTRKTTKLQLREGNDTDQGNGLSMRRNQKRNYKRESLTERIHRDREMGKGAWGWAVVEEKGESKQHRYLKHN